jgi:hypothetical protein
LAPRSRRWKRKCNFNVIDQLVFAVVCRAPPLPHGRFLKSAPASSDPIRDKLTRRLRTDHARALLRSRPVCMAASTIACAGTREDRCGFFRRYSEEIVSQAALGRAHGRAERSVSPVSGSSLEMGLLLGIN